MGWRKNIQRENENNNIPNAIGKKNQVLCELGFFPHLLFLYFPSAFEITKRSGYPKESLTACPKVSVILLYRYLQDTGNALISSFACTVSASPAKHQNPSLLTKSCCPKELTSKVWSFRQSDGTSDQKSTGEKLGQWWSAWWSSTAPDLRANSQKWSIGSYKLPYCSHH